MSVAAADRARTHFARSCSPPSAGIRMGWRRGCESSAEGDDEGFFEPGGPAWTVHAGMGTLVAGIRALLMQALHPGAMAGVHDWSRYRQDPLGRLTGTVRWIVVTTFGTTDQARRETSRVMRFHGRVAGRVRRQRRGQPRVHGRGCGPGALGAPRLHRRVPRLATSSGAGRSQAAPTPTCGSGRRRATSWGWMGRRDPTRSCGTSSPPSAGSCAATSGWMTWCASSGGRRSRRGCAAAYGVLFAGAVASLPRSTGGCSACGGRGGRPRRSPQVALRGAGAALRRGDGQSSAEIAMGRVERLRPPRLTVSRRRGLQRPASGRGTSATWRAPPRRGRPPAGGWPRPNPRPAAAVAAPDAVRPRAPRSPRRASRGCRSATPSSSAAVLPAPGCRIPGTGPMPGICGVPPRATVFIIFAACSKRLTSPFTSVTVSCRSPSRCAAAASRSAAWAGAARSGSSTG